MEELKKIKLSIITINLNNLKGLQKTMQSVFEQKYIDFEYIIIDGSSSDGSKNFIEQYADKLAWWVSEKDNGVYNAMNKGITKAKGEYLLFLNSGDFLNSKTSLSIFFDNSNNEDILYANILKVTKNHKQIKCCPSELSFSYFLNDTLPHQSTMIKKSVFEKTGLYNERLKIVSDWEVFMNAICLHQATYKHIDYCVSVFQADGISSNPNHDELKKERKSVIEKHYRLFIDDYTKAQECHIALINTRASLLNITNSKLYKFLRRITQSSIYKFFKKSLQLF